MKNAVVLLLFFVSLFFFSSCTTQSSQTGPGVTKDIKVTTSVQVKKPILADRTGCAGNLLDGKKVDGWYFETQKQDTVVSCGVTDSDIKAVGYTYGTQWWNKAPWEWLLWVLGLGLIFWLLWLLFNQIPERRVVHVNEEQPNTTPAGTFVPNGYNLVPVGFTLVPNGSSLASAGMSIVSENKVLIPTEGIYLGIRRGGEVFAGEIGPAARSDEGGPWTKEEKKKAEEL